jgi:hypothetical protein
MSGNVQFCLENWNARNHVGGLRLSGGKYRSCSRIQRWRSWSRHCAITRKLKDLGFLIDLSFRPLIGRRVDSCSVRNEYPGSKGGRKVRLTNLPPSAATSWSLKGLSRPVMV